MRDMRDDFNEAKRELKLLAQDFKDRANKVEKRAMLTKHSAGGEHSDVISSAW